LPSEFAHYLTWLSAQPPIRSYVEIGVEAGGSFITTIEYLRRFHPLHTAIGVDPQLSPTVHEYVSRTGGVHFIAGTQASPELHALVDGLKQVDLIFIDGDHSHAAVRADWNFARRFAAQVAFHDIAAENLPGVQALWAEIEAVHRETHTFIQRSWQPNLWAGLGVVKLASRRKRRWSKWGRPRMARAPSV
jgi:cephalosporin hydroxylase